MTVALQTPYNPYTGNGVTTVFPYAFKILDKADLAVYVNGVLQTLDVNYSVSGVGLDGGGSVTFLTGAPANGLAVSIIRAMVPERATDYQFQGDFNTDTVNPDFDLSILLIQDLHTQLGRSLRLPADEIATLPTLPSKTARAGKYDAWDANGDPIASAGTGADAGLRTDLASQVAAADGARLSGYRRTDAGSAARSVYSKLEERITLADFGAVGDDSADDSAAFLAAIASGRRVYGGGKHKVYRINSSIALTGSVDLVGEGCTIKPNGNSAVFTRNGQTPTASTTVSSGATIGSRSFVVASATGIVAGQWCRVVSDDQPTNDTSAFPSHWAKVTNVAGTTIKIDSPFRIGQQGTVTAEFYSTSQIYPTLHIKDVIFDGQNCTANAATGQAIRAYCFESVDIDCEFINWDNNDTQTSAVEIAQCIDTRVRVRVVDHVSKFQLIDVQDCRTAHLRDSICVGGSFGMTISRCEDALMIGNSIQGRKKMENDGDASSTSVRGLKMYGCGTAKMIGNDASDYESPIKVESCHQYDVSHNTVRNAGLGGSSDTFAINVGNQVDGNITMNGVVGFNIVINCAGAAIGVSSGTGAAEDGRAIIIGNQIKSCGRQGIYCLAPQSIVSGNRIDNWGAAAATTYGAIRVNEGATVTGNRFRHSLEATSWCIEYTSSVTVKYTFRDNVCETNNPVFWNAAAEVFTDNRGQSNIANGATSRVITHLMITTPEISDITITPTNNPTNDPGNIYVDTITSTQFTVRCRADPGASTATFGYRVALRMPLVINADLP